MPSVLIRGLLLIASVWFVYCLTKFFTSDSENEESTSEGLEPGNELLQSEQNTTGCSAVFVSAWALLSTTGLQDLGDYFLLHINILRNSLKAIGLAVFLVLCLAVAWWSRGKLYVYCRRWALLIRCLLMETRPVDIDHMDNDVLDFFISVLAMPNMWLGPKISDEDHLPCTPIWRTGRATCGDRCAICWEDYEPDPDVFQLPCDHCFHEKCITAWVELDNILCPMCRWPVNQIKLISV